MRVGRDFLECHLVQHLQRMRAFVRMSLSTELWQREAESDVTQFACAQVLASVQGAECHGEPALINWRLHRSLARLTALIETDGGGRP